jgi:hypothetical protein
MLTKELIEKKLPVGTCVHKTRKGNKFKIVEFKNEKIFFSIPNNKEVGEFYRKSISIQLIIEIYEKPDFDFKDFQYKDCRKSATRGIFNKLKSTK